MAKQFVWKDKYSVRVPSLDAQHKRFFEITSQIHSLLEQRRTVELKENLILLLIEFANYARYHFSYEEKCMKDNKCPGCPEQENAHGFYSEKISNYLKDVRNPNTDVYKLAEEVADFSEDWLVNHILKRDKEYSGCLSKAGVN